MELRQLKLPWQKIRETPKNNPWEIDIGEEAALMLQAERNQIQRVRRDTMDLIIGQYAEKGDKVDLIGVTDGKLSGTELWVNGSRKGVFLKEKEELVFRILPR